MLLFRTLLFALLLLCGVSFALYAATGKAHFRRWGLLLLKWTVLAGLGFFGVLFLQRIL